MDFEQPLAHHLERRRKARSQHGRAQRRLDEMRAVAGEVPALSGRALARASAALAFRRSPTDIDVEEARSALASLMPARTASRDPMP